MENKIIIATHKKYQMPNSDIYIPLHVGAEGKKSIGYIGDNTGDNISIKNPYYCELTGLYWAWKNLEAEFVGLVHYRRYFSFKKKSRDPFTNILTSNELALMTKKYSILVPKKRNYYIETLYSHYAHTHYAEHLDATKNIISEKYPEYLKSCEKVYKRTWGFMFNMMIMRKEFLNNYCQWLFDILFELEKKIGEDKNKLSAFQGRFYGRVSEIMFNVWLDKQISDGRIKISDIKELPYIYMEKIDWKRKVVSFVTAKFAHKKYEGSF